MFKAMNLMIKSISMCELSCVTNHKRCQSWSVDYYHNFYLTCSKSWKAAREHKWIQGRKKEYLPFPHYFFPSWNYGELNRARLASCVWGRALTFPGNIVTLKPKPLSLGTYLVALLLAGWNHSNIFCLFLRGDMEEIEEDWFSNISIQKILLS